MLINLNLSILSTYIHNITQSNNKYYSIMQSQSERYEKKESKSAQRKIVTKKEQINLLLYKNSQIPDKGQQITGKTLNFDRKKIKSSLGSYIQQRKYSIDFIIPNKKVTLTNWVQAQFKAQTKEKSSKNQYIYHHVIGKGGFGKVWKVQDKRTGQQFAMKQMSKAVILTKKSIQSVMNEKSLLTKLRHKFIVNMLQSFQDRETLYLVMDLMKGGDLRYHICKKHKFTQQQARFFAACLLNSLQYLHSKNIIHRDIKPQNLVFNDKGYLHLTDLGIAKFFKEDNFTDTSGTPGYMSPEVMCRQNHSYEVDFYALGVIMYQLMIGKRPYVGKSRKQIREQILAHQIVIKKCEIPEGWSIQAADFINKLIQRKPMLRLGWGGSHQLKNHIWMKDFPWQMLINQQLQSPFEPYARYNHQDVRYQPTKQDEELNNLVKQNTILLRKNNVQQLFEGYSFSQQKKQIQVHTTSSQLGKKKTFNNVMGQV